MEEIIFLQPDKDFANYTCATRDRRRHIDDCGMQRPRSGGSDAQADLDFSGSICSKIPLESKGLFVPRQNVPVNPQRL